MMKMPEAEGHSKFFEIIAAGPDQKIGESTTTQQSERIHRICSLLEAIWMQHPDLRFYQLIEDTAPDTNMDLFFVNDDAAEKNLQNVLERGL